MIINIIFFWYNIKIPTNYNIVVFRKFFFYFNIKFIEPVFSPLGWDWKISAAVLAAFPAREVVIAVLGTIYALGSDVAEDDQGLISRLQTATHDNGELVFNLPMAIGLMVFFALCLQCAATLAIIRRETGGWSLPILAWTYMTTLGYLFALLIYQVGSA